MVPKTLLVLLLTSCCIHPSIGCIHSVVTDFMCFLNCEHETAKTTPIPTPTPTATPACGKNNIHGTWSLAKGSARIVGGDSANYGAVPYQVYIGKTNGYTATQKHCGGTLVGKRWVLTAAHCISNYDLEDLTIGLAVDDSLGDGESKKVTKAKVARVHENYDDSTLDNDIAVLYLEEDIKEFVYANEKIWPACLPGNDTAYVDGEMTVVSGWGDTRMQTPDGVVLPDGPPVLLDPHPLQFIWVPIIENEECINMMKNADPNYVGTGTNGGGTTEKMLCAGYKEGRKDGCQGDSGGPIVSFKEDGAAVLIGITSFGYGCAYPNHPGVYTRLTEYMPWVETAMEEMPYELSRTGGGIQVIHGYPNPEI